MIGFSSNGIVLLTEIEISSVSIAVAINSKFFEEVEFLIFTVKLFSLILFISLFPELSVRLIALIPS